MGTAFVVLRDFLTAWPCSRHSIHLEESPSSQVLFFFASRAFGALLTPISKFTLFLISHLSETASSYLCLTIGFCSAFVKTQSCFLYAAIQAEHDSSLNNSPPAWRRKGREGNASDAEVTAQRVSTNFSSHSAAAGSRKPQRTGINSPDLNSPQPEAPTQCCQAYRRWAAALLPPSFPQRHPNFVGLK